MKHPSIIRICSFGIALFAVIPSVRAADAPVSAAAAPVSTAPAQKLSPTVGVDIIKMTPNPDKTYTLLFQWKDQDKKDMQRSVILNDQSVISIDGKFSTIADITPDVLRKKAVATPAADGVTVVMLKFGKAALVASADQLTAAQIAALKAIAPAGTPASNAAMQKRVDGIVQSLKLNGPTKEARLTAVLMADLGAVRDAHNAGFAPGKSVHEALNAGLQADLTPEQIETVKDALTGGQVQRDFNVYHQIAPGLTAEDDKAILDYLRQAREEALDVKDANQAKVSEPTFKPYKTKIQNYLTAHGHDWKTLYKAFVDAQKAGTPPAAQPAPTSAPPAQ